MKGATAAPWGRDIQSLLADTSRLNRNEFFPDRH